MALVVAGIVDVVAVVVVAFRVAAVAAADTIIHIITVGYERGGEEEVFWGEKVRQCL